MLGIPFAVVDGLVDWIDDGLVDWIVDWIDDGLVDGES